MLMQMVEILGPISIITLIGFLMGRSSIGLETRTLSTVVILVATPALIFHTLISMQVTPDTIRTMGGAALVCISVSGLLGLAALLWLGGPIRSFLPALMMPNSGNMGLPLVVLAFGPDGLRLGIAYFFVVALMQHTLGMWIYSGSINPKTLLRQPLIYSVLAVLVVTFTGVPVPSVILVTTDLLGGMMIPAMLMLLGASLATLEVADLRPALLVALGRLLFGLASAFMAITILGLQGPVAGIVFLLATMPTAIVIYVFAERFQQNAKQVAGSVVVSTILTFICLPLLVWAALTISNETGAAAMGAPHSQTETFTDSTRFGN
jgi:predicted permease